jgi:hypothetical protein
MKKLLAILLTVSFSGGAYAADPLEPLAVTESTGTGERTLEEERAAFDAAQSNADEQNELLNFQPVSYPDPEEDEPALNAFQERLRQIGVTMTYRDDLNGYTVTDVHLNYSASGVVTLSLHGVTPDGTANELILQVGTVGQGSVTDNNFLATLPREILSGGAEPYFQAVNPDGSLIHFTGTSLNHIYVTRWQSTDLFGGSVSYDWAEDTITGIPAIYPGAPANAPPTRLYIQQLTFVSQIGDNYNEIATMYFRPTGAFESMTSPYYERAPGAAGAPAQPESPDEGDETPLSLPGAGDPCDPSDPDYDPNLC